MPLRTTRKSTSRLLKNYSSFPADYGTRRYARSRSSTEPHVQLFVAGDASAERSSAARHPGHGGWSAYPVVAAVRRHVRPRRASVDSAGEAAASAIAADAVLDPQRTFADGRDGLQHVVSLVRSVELGRGGLGCDELHQEPRPVAGGRRGQGVPGASGGAGAGPRSDFQRALHGRRHVAGTWASLKSFQPKQGKSAPPPDDPGNPTVSFRGERRSNETHESKTDAEAQLARKSDGKESKLSYSGNLLVENRNGLIVAAEVFVANGRAERDAALVMLEQIPGRKPVTVGGDKGFDTRDFVAECRHLGVTPHVAQNLARRGGSAIDGRTTQHSSYGLSQKKRKRIEECFGWLKTVALLRKVRHRGVCKVDWIFSFACAAYNLVRMRNLAAVPAL